MIFQRILATVLVLSPLSGLWAMPQAAKPERLRLDYLENPVGIDERKPRFSFELVDPRRSAAQSAYQILVARNRVDLEAEKGPVWDSGKVVSTDTCQISYGGAALEAWTQYYWCVRSFDVENKPSPWSAIASFSTSALQQPDWSARWIEDPTAQRAYKGGSQGWRSTASSTADDYKWIMIDLGAGAIWDRTRLYPATIGTGPGARGKQFPIRFQIFGSDRPEFDDMKYTFRLFDQSEFDAELPSSGPLELKNTSRMKMRYMRLGIRKMAADESGGFSAALAEIELLDGQQLVSRGRPVTSSDSVDGQGWSTQALVDGFLTSSPPEGADPIPATTLRREFSLPAQPQRAWLACSAQGLYEARINGARVGDAVLTPGWSDYKSRLFSNTYDVTALLKQGPNAIGVLLGDGWYSGRVGLAHLFPDLPPRGIYGRKPRFFAELVVDCADGSRFTMSTDDSWSSTLNGPIRSSDIYDGEHYDARQELKGFDAPGYDDSAWAKAAIVTGINPGLNAARHLPTQVVEDLRPVRSTQLRPGVWIHDFGRNLAGWCRIRVEGEAGSSVVLRHGEALNADGSLYTANLRTAKQTDHYILRGGGSEVWEPRFTYHGFRYVEVSCEKPVEVVVRVISNAAPDAGEFQSSNPTLNQIWTNIGNTLRSNYLSFPSDSPQRDERLGWMGDVQVFAPTAIYRADLAAFFTKWMQDVRDGYSSEFRFSDLAPHPFDKNLYFTGGPAWADAGVLVPYATYVAYGDKRLAEIMLPFATRWLDALRSANPDFVFNNERANDYGDWLNAGQITAPGWSAQGCEVPKEVLATAYWAHSAEVVGELAAAVGKDDIAIKAFEMRDSIAAAFQQAFIREDGTILGDTQAGYALALSFHLVPPSLIPQVSAKLAASILGRQNGKLTTGIASTAQALMALSNHNGGELASRLVRDRSFPGWGWQLDQGATTMWERWDGYSLERGFQDPAMNSLNHCAFGSVGEWMMRCVAAIEPDPMAPGYARFLVYPRCGIQIPSAGGRYHSIRGMIETRWNRDTENFTLELTVPPNTSATVILPSRSVEELREGGKPLAEAAPHVVLTQFEASHVTLDVRAGRYRFETKIAPLTPK